MPTALWPWHGWWRLPTGWSPIALRGALCCLLTPPPGTSTFPLIHLLAHALGYEDTTFFRDMTNGMPIAGGAPSTGVLVPRVRTASSTVDQWRAGIPERNRMLVKRVRDAQGTEQAAE